MNLLGWALACTPGTDSGTPPNLLDNHPTVEVCDFMDNDGDGFVDEDATDATAYFLDGDGDGWGNPASEVRSCSILPGFIVVGADCDDADPLVNPAADESCNEQDDNCDQAVDDATSIDPATWYADTDADGFGDLQQAVLACAAPLGFVADATDCDDTLATSHPGLTEVCNDQQDNDCDGSANQCAATGALAHSVGIGGGNSGLGFAVHVAPSVVGETTLDLLVGARDFVEAGETVGAVYLFGGPISGDLATSAAAAILVGDQANGGAGYRLAIIPRMDGSTAILVGAPGRDGGPGGVFLAEGPYAGVRSLGEAELILSGNAPFGRLGQALSAAGDVVDGDGWPDIIAGAYGASTSWVVPGQSEGMFQPQEIGYQIAGGTCSGWSVASIGDGNGDGHDDVAIGDICDSSRAALGGAVYVVHGPLTGNLDLSAADAQIVGSDEALYAGTALLLVGDASGDGLPEFAASAGGGLSWVFSGSVSGVVDPSISLCSVGEYGDDDTVATAIAAPDFDGDGVPDLATGASARSESATEGGVVSIFYSPLAGTYGDDAGDATYSGNADGGHVGRSLASGDIDGTGVDDLVVGTDIEAVFILSGRGW